MNSFGSLSFVYYMGYKYRLYTYPLCLPSEAGNKKALSDSAAYPYRFGVAIAALVPARGSRPDAGEFSDGGYDGEDHLGSLDDLLKGRSKTWRRRL